MAIVILLFLLTLALIGFSANFIARAVYRKLKKDGNEYSLAVSIAIFIVSFAVIFIVIGYVVLSHIPFGR